MRYVRQITQSEWERVHRGVWTPFVQKDFTNSTVFSETVQKRMVITNIGYLGSARMNLYVGNQEWICMCNDLPFIVHNIDTEVGGPERALYNLQSECYVHGIVDSEFFIEAARKGRLDVPPETFDRGSYEPLHTMTARATSVPYVKMKRYVRLYDHLQPSNGMSSWKIVPLTFRRAVLIVARVSLLQDVISTFHRYIIAWTRRPESTTQSLFEAEASLQNPNVMLALPIAELRIDQSPSGTSRLSIERHIWPSLIQ